MKLGGSLMVSITSPFVAKQPTINFGPDGAYLEACEPSRSASSYRYLAPPGMGADAYDQDCQSGLIIARNREDRASI